MRDCTKLVVTTIVALGLISCDIEPVGTGVWEVRIANGAAPHQEIWTIDPDGVITLESDGEVKMTEVNFAGGRIAWRTGADAGDAAQQSFSGTVSGNSFQGTIFTREGNTPVRGSLLSRQGQ